MSHAAPPTKPDHRSDRKPLTGLPKGSVYIYFFGTEDGQEFKLGHTKRPDKRRAQHERYNGRHEPLVWLAVLIGSKSDEYTLKRYFRAHVSRDHSDEWLDARHEELRGYVRYLRDLPYVASSENVDLSQLDRVDSSEWLPNGSRSKSISQLEIPLGGDPWGDLATSVVMEGDYYTHHRIIAAAREAMGGIDLDPASCTEANRVVRATQFFGAKENGLLKGWSGRVWLNPPFGSWGGDWSPYLLAQWHGGHVEQICALASTRAITAKGFHPLVREATAVWIGCGRYEFWGPKAGAPDEGHVVFYFGDRTDEFRTAFERDGLGTVYLRSFTRVLEGVA